MIATRYLGVALTLSFALVQGCASARPTPSPAPSGARPATASAAPTTAAAQSGGSATSSPASGAGAGAAGAGAAGAAGAAPRRTVAQIARTSKRFDGLFTVYQDTANGSLHLVVPKTSVGKEFIYFTHVVDAPVTAGYFRGAFGTNNVFAIRKHFNRIEFVTQPTRFVFDSANALSRAAAANVSPATVVAQEIVAEDSNAYVIRADDIFLTEALTQIKPSPPATPSPTPRFALGTLSRAKTRVVNVKNYPENTDVVVDYVYENPAPVVRGGEDITDPRNVHIVVQHSVIAMPANGYHARHDDPRVGYFTVERNDMLSTRSAPWRDLIVRWDLEKKDPAAAVSEPVTPIVFWIENTTPVEFRDAIAQGVLRWNDAFEAAGFRNAVQVKVQPDTASWDAGDLRYNVLRWTSSPNPPFGGYGPVFVNPRTGQVLGADIMLEYVYVTNRVRYDRLYSRAGLSHTDPVEAVDGSHLDARFCDFGAEWQSNLIMGRQALEARGATRVQISDMVNQAIRSLVLHEVGHTLGLNHNMKASQARTREQVRNRAFTEQHGTMGSVMDYEAINLSPRGQPQGEYYMTRTGPYDVWAIQYGYTPSLPDAAAEQARVAALLARSTEPDLVFGNDADDMRSPGGGIDPRVNVSDLTNDQIGYMTERFEIVDELIDGLVTKYSTPGDSYHELRAAYLVLSGQQANAANVISRFVGGVYVDRAMIGQPGARNPFTPVPRAQQKRAMQMLERYVFSPDAFRAPANLYRHLAMQRRGFEFFGTTEDPKIHERTLTIHRGVLNHLLHPRVLTRLTDTRVYGNEYSLNEMMSDLTRAIFAADARGNVNTFRQQLQLEYVNRLVAMVAPTARGTFDYPTQSAALANLRSIQSLLRGKSSASAETTAHTRHVLFAIERGLEVD